MTPDLPPALRVAIERKAHGLSRNEAAARSSFISQTYRDSGTSRVITTPADALIYAMARMPATYAAVAACLHTICEAHPDFAPATLLDVGAGPGTASWATAAAFSGLRQISLLDSNPVLRALALDLADAGDGAIAAMTYQQGDAVRLLHDSEKADLVIASYMIAELDEAARAPTISAMWTKTRDVLLLVEPGTPAGYERIISARALLIAQGAHVIAPCPHDSACPLIAPDWCHFAQRLPRSRAHKHLKGAELPFEDEKFSYVALARERAAGPCARVLARPETTKIAVTAKLCTPAGLEMAAIPRRNKEDYARARKWRWGDAIFGTAMDRAE